MPGFVKVDGNHQPIAVPYAKVDGIWSPVAIGYVKVDGTWQIWYTAEIVDDFNRADNVSLGTASDGFSVWNELVSGWTVLNNAAEVSSSNQYALSTVRLYKANSDVIVESDLQSGKTGLGAAFWVQDSQNWWAAIPTNRIQSNPGFYSCPSGFTLEGTTCRRTTVYTATYRPTQTVCTNYCPSPYYDTGSQCCASLYPRYSTSYIGIGCRGYGGCASAGGSCSYSQVCADGGFGPCNCRVPVSSCTCYPFGGSCSGCSGTVCTGYSQRCSTVPGGYYCPQGGSLSGTTCTLVETQSANYTPPFNTYPPVIQIWKNVNGSITRVEEVDVSTSIQASGHPRSFRVSTNGNNINVKLYNSTGVQNEYESRTFTSTNAKKGTNVGIIKYQGSPINQATSIDNFRAE